MTGVPSPLDVSLFQLLRDEFGDTLPPLRCTKATLVHISHTLEDLVLTQHIPALLFTGFQESSYWREETERYRALAEIAQQVCIFAGGILPSESNPRQLHVTLQGDDPLRQEWFLAILCTQFAVLLCGQDRHEAVAEEALRQFDTLWTFDPPIINRVLDQLEGVIEHYRPERLESLREARCLYPPTAPDPAIVTKFTAEMIRFEEQLHQTLHRTTDLLNEQIQWRDDLTSALVHDMRTPIQSLILSIEMLGSGHTFDEETTQRMFQVAKRGIHGLQDMVQLILDTNKLAAGQIDITWQPLQPEAFVIDAVAPLRTLIEKQEIAFHVQIDEQITVMWGDNNLLSRVLQNLVGNALKFTESGRRIDVHIVPTMLGKSIEVQVHDNGQGIAPSDLPNIFNATTRDVQTPARAMVWVCTFAVWQSRRMVALSMRVANLAKEQP